eukprot:6204406-Pleurochrysis_carterae.AAC.2
MCSQSPRACARSAAVSNSKKFFELAPTPERVVNCVTPKTGIGSCEHMNSDASSMDNSIQHHCSMTHMRTCKYVPMVANAI